VIGVIEVVLPSLGLSLARPPAPGQMGLSLAVDQPPVHAAHVLSREHGQARGDHRFFASLEPFGVDDRSAVFLQCLNMLRDSLGATIVVEGDDVAVREEDVGNRSRAGTGTGPFFGELSHLATHTLAENTDLSPSLPVRERLRRGGEDIVITLIVRDSNPYQ
jgi:hypothetical protein